MKSDLSSLSSKCKPIATKSRSFSADDKTFIIVESSRLLSEIIIESSTSPWPAQIVAVKDPVNKHKKRLFIDYFQIISLLPKVENVVGIFYHAFQHDKT